MTLSRCWALTTFVLLPLGLAQDLFLVPRPPPANGPLQKSFPSRSIASSVDEPETHVAIDQAATHPVVGKSLSEAVPADTSSSVRQLRLQDIRAVAALGDSMTAAFSALNGIPLEFREISFPIGGAKSHTTLPNLLQPYVNRTLIGPSEHSTDPLTDAPGVWPNGKALFPVPSKAGFNAALSNGKASDGITQAKWLSKAMASHESPDTFNVSRDWKLLIVTLGANDLRSWCNGDAGNAAVSAAHFGQEMNATLALLRSEFPRTFVALLAVPFLSDMGRFRNATRVCEFVQTKIEGGFCPDANTTRAFQLAMNAELQNLAAFWSDTVHAEDFAVVYQPFSAEPDIPSAEYLSELDCFHPGERGHAEFAINLWNSLLTPRAQKRHRATYGLPPMGANASSLFCVD